MGVNLGCASVNAAALFAPRMVKDLPELQGVLAEPTLRQPLE